MAWRASEALQLGQRLQDEVEEAAAGLELWQSWTTTRPSLGFTGEVRATGRFDL